MSWPELTVKTPSGLVQKYKESYCLCLDLASLLAPGPVTASGVRIQVGRAKSQLSGTQGRKREENFSPNQLETPKEAKAHPGTPSQGHCPYWKV